ncbi:MAG: TolC family protein [Acidobacteria bacterium]|nr:MAG: TolC family protein [Acidobacteriota bacterium]
MRERSRNRAVWSWRWIGLAAVGCMLSPGRAVAQPAPSGPLSLYDAIQLALKNYPAIKESRARAQAADEGIGVARTAFLPRLDMLWQENRATHNNVFGLLLPQPIVPPISGPVLGTRSYDSVWGSAAGVQLSWEAIDFGLRKANVDVARAQSVFGKARSDLTELDVAAAAADAFVTVLAADQAVRAVAANVDRLQVFANTVRTLVANQLRPGADESRANAELAIAKNQLSQAVQAAEIARAALADAIGAAGIAVEPAIGRLANPPDLTSAVVADLTTHPGARAALAAVETVRARERVLDRSYFPHVSFQTVLAGRGSGAQVPGQPLLGDGLWLQVPNWAAGMSVTFPAFDLFSVKARKRVELQNELAERARYDQTLQNLTTQNARARALMKAAVEIARNTPVERQAATDAESRARARYESGLASVTEVAEAQRLLAQAEADDAVARLGVWRALLAVMQAQGNLQPFLNQVR